MKLLILSFLLVSSTAFALEELPAKVVPAEVIAVSSNNMFPTATLSLTYLLPCGGSEVGVLNELDRNTAQRIVGLLLRAPKPGGVRCLGMPREKTIQIKVSNQRGGDLDKIIVLGQKN